MDREARQISRGSDFDSVPLQGDVLTVRARGEDFQFIQAGLALIGGQDGEADEPGSDGREAIRVLSGCDG